MEDGKYPDAANNTGLWGVVQNEKQPVESRLLCLAWLIICHPQAVYPGSGPSSLSTLEDSQACMSITRRSILLKYNDAGPCSTPPKKHGQILLLNAMLYPSLKPKPATRIPSTIAMSFINNPLKTEYAVYSGHDGNQRLQK